MLATIQLTAQNNALDFDGSNDYVSISSSSSLQISNNITLEEWIKLDNTSGSKIVVLSANEDIELAESLKYNGADFYFVKSGESIGQIKNIVKKI